MKQVYDLVGKQQTQSSSSDDKGSHTHSDDDEKDLAGADLFKELGVESSGY